MYIVTIINPEKSFSLAALPLKEAVQLMKIAFTSFKNELELETEPVQGLIESMEYDAISFGEAYGELTEPNSDNENFIRVAIEKE